MAIPYTQASMALIRAVDGTFISYPFIESGDTTTKVYNLVCTQRASDYNAAQIALDDNMGNANNAGVIDLPSGWADSNAYFVGDTGHAPIGGGMISFTRTFCNIPQSTTIASGSAFVTFPGISSVAGQYEFIKFITSAHMTSGTRGITIRTTKAHNVVVDDNIDLSLDYTVGADPFIHSIRGNFKVLQVADLFSIRVDIGHYWNSQVTIGGVDGQMIQTALAREPINANVSTLTRYDYILPGVSPGITSILDVSIPPSFSVTEALSGLTVDTVVDITVPNSPQPDSTIPSLDEYLDMINDGTNIITESSLSVWSGNILVQKTITVKAK